ncbi:hypothetical protein Tco_1417587 [Tanacetum coccineum]
MIKPKGNNVAGPSVVNMMEHNNSFRKPRNLKKDCKGGKVGNKANGSGKNGSVDGSTNPLKGKYVESGCTTALDVVPWETNGESVLRESC